MLPQLLANDGYMPEHIFLSAFDSLNDDITCDDLANALGADQVNALSAHSGLSQNDLLEGLSQYLPQVVDHLTPNGRMPTDQELSRSL